MGGGEDLGMGETATFNIASILFSFLLPPSQSGFLCQLCISFFSLFLLDILSLLFHVLFIS